MRTAGTCQSLPTGASVIIQSAIGLFRAGRYAVPYAGWARRIDKWLAPVDMTQIASTAPNQAQYNVAKMIGHVLGKPQLGKLAPAYAATESSTVMSGVQQVLALIVSDTSLQTCKVVVSRMAAIGQ